MGIIDDEIARQIHARKIAADHGQPADVPDWEDPHPTVIVPLGAYHADVEDDDNDYAGDPWLVAAAEQEKAEQKEKGDALGLRWVTDAIASPPPERPYLVDGLLQEGEIAVLAGPRATMKSWLTYDLADRLSSGEGMFLGKLPVHNTARTLIAQGEIDERNAYERWEHLTKTSGIPTGVAESFDRWRIKVMAGRNSGMDRDTGTSWSDEWTRALMDPRVEQSIVDEGFRLLIVDPWAVYFNGKENSNDEAEQALDQLRDLAHRTGCAVLIVHHITAKGGAVNNGGDPEDLWRGASRLADWASTRITLLPHYKREADWKKAGLDRRQARRVVDIHFLRRGKGLDDFTIEWDPRTGRWNTWTPTVTQAGTENTGRAAALNPVDVARRLTASGVTEWPSRRAAANALGLSYAASTKYLDAAESAGYLVTFQKGSATGYRLAADHPPLTLDLDEPPHERVPLDAYEDDMPDPRDQEF